MTTRVQASRRWANLADSPLQQLLKQTIAEIVEWDSAFAEPGQPPLSSTTRHPEVGAPGGLPDGWTLLASHPGDTVGTMLLVTRQGGGAFVMYRDYKYGNTRTQWFSDSIADLYETVRFICDGGVDDWGATKKPSPTMGPMVEWVESVMASMYDLTDETEAAEAALIGLGAPFTVLPRAAQPEEFESFALA